MFRNLEVQILVYTYQFARGIGNRQEAQSLADRALKLDRTETTYNALAWSGSLSGAANKIHLDQAEKANESAKAQDAAIIDTLARIMEALGNRDQALSRFSQTRELDILKSCKDDLEAGK